MRPRLDTAAVAILVLSGLLAACISQPFQVPTWTPDPANASPSPAETEATGRSGELPPVDPTALSGQIVTAGSSTVFPLSERIAERFEDEGFQGNVTVDSIGSGAGFERFCETGETDISNASRPVSDSEVEACRALGLEPIEFRIGTDALAVTVSRQNDFADSVTLAQLAALFSTAETWADVDPSWPDEPIQRFVPGTDSGTFDYFVEEVFDENEALILDPAGQQPQLSEDDNVLVTGISGSPYAIGFFGYAYFAENQASLKVLTVEGIAPNADTVEAGEYPLARPLFIYSDPGIMRAKPQVAGFINFFLAHVNEEVTEAGYFPASEAALESARQNWLAAMNQ